jgi:hypothetical protein
MDGTNMAHERSLFRKVQLVLEYCQARKHNTIPDLKKIIKTKSPVNFAYYKTDDATGERKIEPSTNSINTAVNLCVGFGLVEPNTGHLTKLGVSATDPTRYARIMGACAVDILAKKGIALDKIESIISTNLLQHKPPIPPTAREIWDHLRPQLTFREFTPYMNILGLAGILTVVQKKVYLPMPKQR